MIAVGGVMLIAGCGGDDLAPELARGRDIARSDGCASCHGPEGQGGLAPPWQGLAGTEVTLDDGRVVVADTEYLRRSISDPAAEFVAGYTLKMPPNTLDDDDIDALVAYIEQLERDGS